MGGPKERTDDNGCRLVQVMQALGTRRVHVLAGRSFAKRKEVRHKVIVPYLLYLEHIEYGHYLHERPTSPLYCVS